MTFCNQHLWNSELDKEFCQVFCCISLKFVNEMHNIFVWNIFGASKAQNNIKKNILLSFETDVRTDPSIDQENKHIFLHFTHKVHTKMLWKAGSIFSLKVSLICYKFLVFKLEYFVLLHEASSQSKLKLITKIKGKKKTQIQATTKPRPNHYNILLDSCNLTTLTVCSEFIRELAIIITIFL